MTDFIGFGVASKSSMISRIGLRVFDAEVEAATDHFVDAVLAVIIVSFSSSSSSSEQLWGRIFVDLLLLRLSLSLSPVVVVVVVKVVKVVKVVVVFVCR
jgi:hypothetical protein